VRERELRVFFERKRERLQALGDPVSPSASVKCELALEIELVSFGVFS
jgi:hypothetical protein